MAFYGRMEFGPARPRWGMDTALSGDMRGYARLNLLELHSLVIRGGWHKANIRGREIPCGDFEGHFCDNSILELKFREGLH